MVDLPSYPEDAARRETVVESRSYASWGRRVGAYLIDTLIILAPLAIAIGFLVAMGGDDDDSAWAAVGIVYLVTLVLPFVYYTVFHGRGSGQTPGKRALGIRVTGDGSIRSNGYGRAFGRTRSSRSLRSSSSR